MSLQINRRNLIVIGLVVFCLTCCFFDQTHGQEETATANFDSMFEAVIQFKPVAIGKLTGKSAYRTELELSDQQVEELRNIHRAIYESLADQQTLSDPFQSAILNPDGQGVDQQQNFNSLKQQLFSEAAPEFVAILDHTQPLRFKQLTIWKALSSDFLSVYQSNENLDRIAGISEVERERLDRNIAFFKSEFLDELNDLWLNIHRQTRESVSRDSLIQLDSILGEPGPLKLNVWQTETLGPAYRTSVNEEPKRSSLESVDLISFDFLSSNQTSIFDALSNQMVSNELSLSANQKTSMRSIRADLIKELNSLDRSAILKLVRSQRNSSGTTEESQSNPELESEFQDFFHAQKVVQRKYHEQCLGLLLPKQTGRLKELVVQSFLNLSLIHI